MREALQFGMFAPQPHITVGMPELAASIASSGKPLSAGVEDPAYRIAREGLVAADRAGFDIVLFAERHLGTDLNAWTMAGAATGWTERLKLMVAVHPGLWHPQLVAKMTATLDRMAKGRSAINIVTGWNVAEAKMYGGEIMLEDDERYVRAEEFIQVLRGMWTERPFSYKGRYYDVDRADLMLRPATATPPEIYTASRSPTGLDMVARTADWWFIAFDKSATTADAMMDSVRDAITDMRRRSASYGRNVKIAFNPFAAFGPSHETAMRDTLALLSPDDADRRKIESRVAPAMRAGLVGRPADVRARLEQYYEIGVDLMLLQFVPTAEKAEEIGRELIVPMRGKPAKAA